VASYWISHDAEVRIHDERLKPIEWTDVIWADSIMFTAYTGYQVTDAYRLTKHIKRLTDKKVIWGGPHVTLLPKQCLDDKNIDAIIQGYMETGEYEIPWELVDIGKYINPATERAIYISSYSCVGNCSFCQTTPKRKLIFIPPGKVEKDIDNLMKLYPFRELVFFDSTIFTMQDRALFLSKLMKKYNLKWICDSRADEICRTPKEMLDSIVDSGLRQITVGLETGNERMADFIKKGKNHIQKFKNCAEILSQYDTVLASGLIFGMPTETLDELKQTIEYVEKIKLINKNFRLSTTFWKPLPNTEMTEYIKENYGYKEPNSLDEWSNLGASNHFKYNAWMDNPWIKNQNKYKEIYDDFIKRNAEILI
jgi:radical SAM superfamily enzyme YgiQ (UPF0313 family)